MARNDATGNRAQWEAEAVAKRLGWRGGLAGEIERRARDRRIAKLEAAFAEPERRAGDRRAR